LKLQEKEVTRVIKLNVAATKKHETTSNEMDEYVWHNQCLKEDNKEVTKKLTASKKLVDGQQLSMKHQHAERKAELGVEKEQLTLECVHETRLKRLENVDHHHRNKQELVQNKKRAAINMRTAA
jgi:hypothetical protein